MSTTASSRQQPFVRTRIGNLRETIRFKRRQEQTSHRARYGLRRYSGNGTHEIANENEHRARIGRSAYPAQQDENERGEVGRHEGRPEEGSLKKH